MKTNAFIGKFLEKKQQTFHWSKQLCYNDGSNVPTWLS